MLKTTDERESGAVGARSLHCVPRKTRHSGQDDNGVALSERARLGGAEKLKNTEELA